jgi:hypothetical protein
MGNEGEFKLESNDDELMIETSSLLLQITTVDAAGQTHQFTVSPPIEDGGNNGRSNRGRGNDNSGDSDDDDDNGDHD